jgi:hypothetical protein
MSDQPPCYMAFLLQLWCVTDEDGVVWHASLEDAYTGERKGFANVQILYAFLTQQLVDASWQPRSAPNQKGER